MGKDTIGEFEEVVMLTVAVLYKEAYGISIKEEMEKRLGKSVNLGAMRIALKRLEGKGFLKSEFGEVTAVRGGKRKRYYQVTPHGKKVLQQVMDVRKNLWDSIPSIAFDMKIA
jgi:PadR family transcriptional regulator, regulatory protein PadR